MLVKEHILVSAVFGGVWYCIFRSMPEAVACFFSGFILDADHFFDYYYNHPFTLNLTKIYHTCRQRNFNRVFFFFHSFEFVILMWLIGVLLYPNRIWLAIATGIAQHVLLDHFFNPVFPLGYFLTYRILKGFRIEHIVRR